MNNNTPLSTALIIVDGNPIGRDPRDMTIEELNALGHFKQPLLRAIRKKCLDCAIGQHAEVRKCVETSCHLWAYRMGTNPFAKRNNQKPSNDNQLELEDAIAESHN